MSEEPREETEAEEEQKELKVVPPSITIVLIVDAHPHYEVVSNTMNPYILPTLLRQLAQNFEEAVLKTRSLIE
ncbi:hypothetical protein HQ586_00685 [Candidatus Bathyarchaeota archaeon]|nr:hypothetical protein [Candidatus Bathyarchaeota archaeon]